MIWSGPTDAFHGEWDQGVGYYVYPTRRFKTVTIYATWIRELRPQDRSLGAVLPHVLRRGTDKWPNRMAIEQKLEGLYGASFRAEVGKIGDKQLLSFYITVVNGEFLPGKPDTVRDALDFLTEVLQHPQLVDGLFPDDTVEQEKVLITRQIASLINDKGQYALSRLVELVADGEPFGLKKLGTVDEVNAVSAKELVALLHQVRQAEPCAFIIVGDVNPEQLRGYVERYRSSERPQALAQIAPYRGHHHGNTVIEEADVQQGKLNFAYRTGMTASHPDFPSLMMYAGILGGYSHSKLFINVREKASLAYYAYARLDPALALMIIGAGIEFEDYEPARAIIEEQVNVLKMGQISEDEMAFTLKAYQNEILSEEDNPGQLIGRQLEHILVGGGLSGTALMKGLEAVTRDDVVRVAQQVELDTVYFLTRKEGKSDGH